jgi:hypothetical protein
MKPGCFTPWGVNCIQLVQPHLDGATLLGRHEVERDKERAGDARRAQA